MSGRGKFFIALIVALFSFCAAYYIIDVSVKKYESRTVSVIPAPFSVELLEGEFKIAPETKIIVNSKSQRVKEVAEYFVDRLNKVSGYNLAINNGEQGEISNAIVFSERKDENLGEEGYSLKIGPKKVLIEGMPHGIFYGVQTVFQLLPPEAYSDSLSENIEWKMPAVSIVDKPRFKWRGMHLDVCRHFFPVSFVKKYIDLIALHKLNVFHWHLTEDQGWRIEIKKYPKLTEIGAWRKGTQIAKTRDIDSIRYGGFYTQDEIREVVEYAKKRFVRVIPEIEMPGHSRAAIASYPELSCKGEKIDVGTRWGVYPDIYCAGNDSVFTFLENVLTEVMDLFPSEYIHIGGDEAWKINWEKCSKCQARIKNENLKDESQLQSWFISKIERFLNSRGRQIIGWDEILEGGLAPNAAVMSWRGTSGGIEAAKLKHYVVMSPTDYCYFDYYQADPEGEPLAIGGYLPLEKVFSYEPMPRELNYDEKKYILGVQANLWTEYIADVPYAEYMLLPRLSALSEVAWDEPENKDWNNFSERMEKQYKRFDELGVNYRKPTKY